MEYSIRCVTYTTADFVQYNGGQDAGVLLLSACSNVQH